MVRFGNLKFFSSGVRVFFPLFGSKLQNDYILRCVNENNFFWTYLKNIEGTESIETIIRMSKLHPISSDIISIFDRLGSKGNSTIFLPSLVNWPVLSKAPKIQSWYICKSKKYFNADITLQMKSWKCNLQNWVNYLLVADP